MSVVLSEHLPLLASAPEGIKKLRGLILELAVRGKLVQQDPEDEPARELLKRIAQERTWLEKEGVRQKAKTTPLTEECEQPFELPNNWVWTKLGIVALINPRNAAGDSIDASFVPMAMIGNRFEGSHQQELRKWGEVKQGFTHFAEGDIGVAKITPCFENSKACVFEGLENGIGAGTTELHVVRPIGQTLAPRYVLAYLKAPMFLLVGETKMTGTAGQKRLPKDFLEANPFPLPPLAEQHRIVAKVDELMALCDRLEAEQADAAGAHARLVETLLGTLCQSTDAADLAANWQRLAEHFDTLFTTEASIEALKQTVLQLAVMGKLVPQDPNDEPASELLKNIAQERTRLEREGVCKKSKAMPPVGADDQLFALPNTWMWARLGSVSVTSTGKTPATSKAEYYEGTLPFIGPGQLTPEGKILPPEKRLSNAGAGETTLANPGDILMVCIGGSIGKAAIANMKIAFNQQINCASPILISNRYLYAGMTCQFFQKVVLAKATGSATPIINRSNWDEIPLPLAPLAEQHRIVAKVDELMALCDRLKADLATARQHQALLADTLIDAALEAA